MDERRMLAEAESTIRRGILQGLVDARGVPLAPPEPAIEREGIGGLADLLEVMGQVSRGAVDFNGIEIGAQACRELLRLIDESETHRQAAESHLRLVDEARRERDEYLGNLSAVAKARDMAQHRADVAERYRDEWRAAAKALERLSDELFAQVTALETERDELRRREAEVIAARDCACAERDLARDKADHATRMAQQAQAERDEMRLRGLEPCVVVPFQASALETVREACRRVRAGDKIVCLEASAYARVLDELMVTVSLRSAADQLEADRAELEPDDGEPPRHLHCCECEQCQPGPRGCVTINVYGGSVEVHS